MSETNLVFTLVINKQPYEFDSKLFGKVSQKAAELIKSGQYYAKICPEISEDAVIAFVAACKYERFQVIPAIAYELLDLSQEWKFTNLFKIVQKYIKEKNVERQGPPLNFEDPLGDLLALQNANQETEEDLRRVAQVFNRCLTSDELFEVQIDNLCQIVHFAEEYEEIDQQLYLDFILKLLQTNPFAAVPLLLRLDFEQMNKEQNDAIFETQEVHDANIGYFIASQLTSLRNRAARQRNTMIDNLTQKSDALQQEMTNLRHETEEKVSNNFNDKMNSYQNIIEQQRQAINSVKQQIEDSHQLHERQKELFAEETNQLREEIDRAKIRMDNCKKAYEKMKRTVKSELEDQSKDFTNGIRKRLDDITENGNERREAMTNEINGPFNSLKRNFIRSKKNTQTIRGEIEKSRTDAQNMKAVLSAKMVQDFMRFDNFIRRKERRFKIFDDDLPSWNVSGAEVKGAETELTSIERRLDKLCPIRHTLSQ